MSYPSLRQLPLGILLTLMLVVPVCAGMNYKISNYGNGHQIWFEAEDYDERNPDTDQYYPVVDADGAFGRAVTRTGSAGGMIRWTFDIGTAGGQAGTWYFWGRVLNPSNASDYMLVEGDPDDATIPTGPPFPGGSGTAPFVDADDRIFENDMPTWQWAQGWDPEGHVKELHNGKNTMYVFHRQGDATVFWDVFVWTDDPDYQPTDDDYRNATALVPGTAFNPTPGGGATDVPVDAVLSWSAGVFAGRHDVYFGTDPAAVAEATATVDPAGVYQGRLDTNAYALPPLAFGQTYYWRVDEVNQAPDATVFQGSVWSFTVEPYAYAVQPVAATASSAQAGMGPDKTIDRSGLTGDLHGTEPTTMWLSAGAQPNWIQYEFDQVCKLHELEVWNFNQLIESFLGFGARQVTIETSVDGMTWTPVADVPEFARAPAAPDYAANTTVNLGGAQAKYVKLTIDTNWSGMAPQTGLAEVRFSSIPVRARAPQPTDAATGVPVDASLNWRPGRDVVSHTVYFDADADAVTQGTAVAQTVTEHSYTPVSLDFGATYYWRIDEVNATTYPGSVWSFTTEEYAVVDDFESYTAEAGEEVFSTWLDGFDNPTANGAIVGLATAVNGTFCDTTTFHGGKQSMPFAYDSTTAPLSETTRTFDTPQDWTAHGVKSLSLWFQGTAGSGGQLYLKINNTKLAYNGNAGDLAKPVWRPWNIDLSTVGGNLAGVAKLTIGIEGAGAQGLLYIDDIRLYPQAPAYISPADPGPANLQALYAFEGNINDTSGHGLNGTLKQGTLVVAGRPAGGSALKIEKAGYVDLGNPKALDFAVDDWAVTAWFKTAMTGTGEANVGAIYGKGGDGTGGKRYCLILSNTTEGVVSLITDDDVTKYVADAQSLTNDDQWHFVAGQRQGTALEIYIDGQLEGTTAIAAAYDLSGTSQHNGYIGAITNHVDGSLYKLFDGLIDDVRIYARALSQAEILWLAGYTKPVAKPF